MRRARGSAARQCRARVMDDARCGENEVEAGTRTTVEYDDASDGESFGAFATPARAFADGTTENDDDDDDDDDDDFGCGFGEEFEQVCKEDGDDVCASFEHGEEEPGV